MSEEGSVPIRSFRNCFKLERRIHKIDRWRIPVPFGIPLRSVGYAVGAELVLQLAGQLPGFRVLIGALNAPLRFIVLPVVVAYLLTCWEIDGRPAHRVLRSWTMMRLGPSRVVAWRSAPPPGVVALGAVTVAPDERGARLRPAVVHGPARVLVRYPFAARQRWRTLQIEPEPGPPRWRGKEIVLERGQRMVIR